MSKYDSKVEVYSAIVQEMAKDKFDVLQSVMALPNGLYVNTRDGRQFKLVAHEVIRPDTYHSDRLGAVTIPEE